MPIYPLSLVLLVLVIHVTLVQLQDTETPYSIEKLRGTFMGPPVSTIPPIYRPPQVPLDVDNYPVAPDSLNLEQVHIYIRHGERTPVGVRLADPPASISPHWLMCKTARQFKAAVAGAIPDNPSVIQDAEEHNFLHTRKVVERTDGNNVEGECLLGELTDVGRQVGSQFYYECLRARLYHRIFLTTEFLKSTYHYGLALRRLYVEKLGFLPDSLNDTNSVYFRTTNMPRTTESLQQIIHGLYPTSKCNATSLPPILVRNGQDENLLGNTYSCKRLELLKLGFAQAAATAYNPTLEPLDKKVSKYIGGAPVRVDGKPRASGVLDTIRAATAHGIKVPSEFEEKSVLDVLERAVVNEWFSDKTEEVRKLGMGRLLDDMGRKMQSKATNGADEPLKILVHSTHDTALAGLAATLDVFDEKWPAFTASLTFELFKKVEPKSSSSYLQWAVSPFRSQRPEEFFVRLRYANKNLPLPICADEGKHLPGSPEFCTLDAFVTRIKELTPNDWDEECKVPRTAVA